MTQVVLIDGKNFAYRMHWTHRNLSSHGFPTSLLHGGLSGLASLVRRMPHTPFVWCWDGAGDTWRHELAKGVYKAQRAAANEQNRVEIDNMHRQIPLLKKFLRDAGFRCFEVKNLECDDLIGILVKEIVERNLFDTVVIHSSDKDFYQFIGKRVKVLKGLDDGKLKWAAQKEIEDKFGIPCSKWTQLRAIIGDPSDNIPHIFPGVGPKTAVKFLNSGVDVTAKSCKVVATVRGKECNFAKNWERIQLNYLLSQIPTDWRCPYFSDVVRLNLKNLMENLRRKDFLRDKATVESEEAYNSMTRFFARFELEALMGARDVLWKIP